VSGARPLADEIRAAAERPLTPAECQAMLEVPISARRGAVAGAGRLVLPALYPTPAERLAYVRRAHQPGTSRSAA
jgi:hypothetical protein